MSAPTRLIDGDLYCNEDEEADSNSTDKDILKINCEKRVSDTTKNKQGQENIIGDLLFDIHEKDLVNLGVLIRNIMIIRQVDFSKI